ncbi:MAG: flagellar basal body rod protein FlgB [Planctomycetes bacterium]|nr:flagellar basal body rod protein FlgB [Planctomycetota bacterium]
MLEDQHMLNLSKLLDVASLRGRVHAANIANQNVPGYRAQAVNFEEDFLTVFQRDGAESARKVEASIYEPRNTMVGNDGNDVAVDKEITAAAENTLLYNTYVALLRGKHQIMQTAIKPGA